ncbi:type I-E CRISPR-associated protein Cas7/Cse4/CasC [Glycomyces sp. L485]|uniref:type I-E CRISPR-associated protein Cas7/Cse4/CasC n=1 Tax=Glycomyces sp. L485 TaxID=2909235 RepID=UPI001F4A0F35|nr:type I-E CRISPR-associated protein Cas7/Cse4/CasC [Glycomyces sp. L485]MCH7230517.1 type I-E CRISPR-associated protein Cas7/Cse4/CasC [Glycomyces sp. L485]
MSRTIIDIHALQTVPPANLNRDDTGSPKTAVYGGARRARVSSQSWKRAVRLDFRETLDGADLGWRTKQIVRLVANRVTALAPELEEQARDLTVKAFSEGGIKVKVQKKDNEIEEPGYLVFLSTNQIENLAGAIVATARSGEKPDKKALKRILQDHNSIDVALFGRMIADDAALNVDAACQVAHAISVHPVETEFDYFTAVDDEKEEQDETGAGMIGTVEFNSATLYRYATVDVDRLCENLGDDEATVRATRAFLQSFITSMPSGKMNTFANRTLPEAVLVTVRDTQAINLVGAYEQPIRQHEGRVEAACELLAKQLEDIADTYEQVPVRAWALCVGSRTKSLAEAGEETTITGLLDGAAELVTERIGES